MQKRQSGRRKALEYYMTRTGLNQLQLALLLGLSQSHVSRLLRGKAQPSLETLQKLARVTRLPVETILADVVAR